jgi:ABC-type nitrate/sulfonate/bicarbonate transport system permease component
MKRFTPTAVLLPAIACALLLTGWEIVCRAGHIPAWFVPRPSEVVVALGHHFRILLAHSGQTLLETAWGFLFALIAGVGIALLLDIVPVLRKAVYPLLIISQTVPIISVAPLIIMWFGYGIASKVFIVALVCFFPITTSLLDGFRTTDENHMKLLRSMGAGSWRVLAWVRFPSALPSLFSGLRIAATYSIMSAVIGEWLGGAQGLGIYMTRSAKSFMIANVFAAIFIITVLSLALYGLIEGAARLCIPWYYHRDEMSR